MTKMTPMAQKIIIKPDKPQNQKPTEPETHRTAKMFPFFQVETARLIPQVDSDWCMHIQQQGCLQVA